eukprot:293289-Rhodomonas_salina.2
MENHNWIEYLRTLTAPENPQRGIALARGGIALEEEETTNPHVSPSQPVSRARSLYCSHVTATLQILLGGPCSLRSELAFSPSKVVHVGGHRKERRFRVHEM